MSMPTPNATNKFFTLDWHKAFDIGTRKSDLYQQNSSLTSLEYLFLYIHHDFFFICHSRKTKARKRGEKIVNEFQTVGSSPRNRFLTNETNKTSYPVIKVTHKNIFFFFPLFLLRLVFVQKIYRSVFPCEPRATCEQSKRNSRERKKQRETERERKKCRIYTCLNVKGYGL